MIFAVGVDTVEVARIQSLWQRSGERFLARVFTAAERDYCLAAARPAESLAARFAAKEATLKCLRTGWSERLGFRQVEVVREASGAVAIRLHGAAAETAARHGIQRLHLSLSHDGGAAVAFVLAEA
jgi:holo-[acyl-carrier protein] synthase